MPNQVKLKKKKRETKVCNVGIYWSKESGFIESLFVENYLEVKRSFFLRGGENSLWKRSDFVEVGLMSRVFAYGLRDQGSIPVQVIQKTQKMVLDAA